MPASVFPAECRSAIAAEFAAAAIGSCAGLHASAHTAANGGCSSLRLGCCGAAVAGIQAIAAAGFKLC